MEEARITLELQNKMEQQWLVIALAIDELLWPKEKKNEAIAITAYQHVYSILPNVKSQSPTSVPLPLLLFTGLLSTIHVAAIVVLKQKGTC